MERLKESCDSVLNTMSEIQLEEKHRKFLTETMMVGHDVLDLISFSFYVYYCLLLLLQGNIERIKRARLHTQETRDNMTKVLYNIVNVHIHVHV